MPELPEVETVRRTLEARILGRRVVSALLHRADFAEPWGANARPCTAQELLEGGRLTATHRHGKQFVLEADDGRCVGVQLGMSGQVLVVGKDGSWPSDHVHVEWRLNDGLRVAFRDPRRFGRLRTFSALRLVREGPWAELGPDALKITVEHLASACKGRKRAIKALLLDQTVLAGVGNIYADEALFVARVRPGRRAGSLRRDDLSRLAAAVREVLRRAVDARGSSLRDYRDADGAKGGAQLALAVYGRGGEVCVRCGARLRQATLFQRTTVWCGSCQG